MEPLTFEFKIKNDIDAEIEKAKKSLGNLQEVLSLKIDSSGATALTTALKGLKAEELQNVAKAVNEMNQAFAQTPTKVGVAEVLPQFEKVTTAINKMQAQMGKVDFSDLTSQGALKMGSSAVRDLQDIAKTIPALMNDAMAQKGFLSSDALNKWREQVSGVVAEMNKVIETKLGAGSGENYGFVKNLRQMQSMLESSFKIVPEDNVMSGYAKSTTTIANEIYKAFENVKREVMSLRESLGESGFTELKNKAEAAATAVAKLADAVKTLKVSSDSNKALTDMLIGLGQVVRTINLALPKSDATNPSLGTEQIVENVRKNKDTIERDLRDLQKARERVFEAMQIGKESGMSNAQISKMQAVLEMLQGYDRQLRVLREDSVKMSTSNPVGEIIDKTSRDLMGSTKGLLQTANEYKSYTKIVTEGMAQIESMQTRLSAYRNSASGIVDVSKLDEEIRKLADYKARVEGIVNIKDKSKMFDGSFTDMIQGLNAMIASYEKLISMTNKQNSVLIETAKLGNKIKEAMSQASSSGLNIDTSKLTSAMAKLQDFVSRWKNADLSDNHSLDKLKQEFSQILKGDINKTISEFNKEMKRMESSTNQTSTATQKLTQEEQSLANAIKNATGAGRQQSQVLSDLKMMAMQYFSAYGAWGFAKEMAQVTGELELQEKSLEVILGNASKAQEMYSQIRDLSQMSPFTFMDLMKSTRQLAAFGIETKDLYGTMKSLSDIGAGLNVDVNRLILAYGHTRSYGYLSGIQNRQFENAGIDMIGGLVDKYNKLAQAEKEAGRQAEFVTRKDIFSKMRDKSIPFADVEDVVMSLDEEGGKFYNMQQKQFETLGGKLRNLRNNYKIMLSEMGKSSEGVIMTIVSGLNNATENWNEYRKIIFDIVAALGTFKAAQLAVNAIAGKGGKVYSAAYGVAISQRSEQNMIASSTRGTSQSGTVLLGNAYAKEINNAKELTRIQKIQAALHSNVSKEVRKQILAAQQCGEAYTRAASRLEGWRLSAERLKWSFRGLVANIKAFGASMMASFASMAPMLAISAVVGAITSYVQRMSELSSRANDMISKFRDNAKTNIQGISETMDKYRGQLGLIGDNPTSTEKTYRNDNGKGQVTGSVFDIDTANMDAGVLQSIFDDLKNKLETASPIYDKDFFDIMKAEDQGKQVEAIYNRLADIKFAEKIRQENPTDLANIDKETGGSGEKSFSEELKAYNEAESNLKGRVANLWANLSEDEQKEIEKYGKNRTKAIRKWIMNNGGGARATEYGSKVGMSFVKDPNGFGTWLTSSPSLDKAGEKMGGIVNNLVETAMKDFSGNPGAFNEYLMMYLRDLFAQNEISDPEIQNSITYFLTKNVTEALSKKGSNVATPLWNRYLSDMVGTEATKNMLASGINEKSSQADVDKAAKDAIEQAKKTLIEKGLASANDMNLFKIGAEWYKSIFKGLENVAAQKGFKMAWQNRAVKMGLTVSPDIDVDYTDFWNKQRKMIKDVQEKFNSAAKQRIKAKLGVDIQLDLNAKSFQNAIHQMKVLYHNLAEENKKIWTKAGWKQGNLSETDKERLENNSGLREDLKDYWTSLENGLRAGKGLDNEGLTWNDPTKDKNKSNKSGGSNKDKQAEEWANEAKYLKEAWDWYKKWYDETKNKPTAISLVKEQFGKYIKEGILKAEDLDNIDKYMEIISKKRDEILASVEKYGNKEKKGYKPEQRKQTASQYDSILIDKRYTDFQEKSKDIESEATNAMTLLLDKYSRFRQVLEATGDVTLADQMFGTDFQWQNKVEVITRYINSILEVWAATGKISLNDKVNGVAMMDVDEESLKKYVGLNLGEKDKNGVLTKESMQRIDAVVAMIKKWQELKKELINDTVSEYSEILKASADFQSQQTRIEEERRDKLTKIGYLDKDGKVNQNASPEVKRAARQVNADYNLKAMGKSVPYFKLMNATLAQSVDDMKQFVESYKDSLLKALEAGSISAEEYASKIESVNNQMNSIETKQSNVASFFSGGLQGLFQNKIDTAKAQISSFGADYQNALAEGNKEGAASALSNLQGAQANLQGAQGGASTIAIIDKIINGINDNVQSLTKALDNLADSLDYMGDSGDSIRNSNFYGFMQGFSQGSQGATDGWNSLKNGDIAGTVDGVVRSITGWYTGIAQWHDNKLSREIQNLDRDVQAIEDTLKDIDRRRERTLGYDANSDYYDSLISQYHTEAAQKNAEWEAEYGKKSHYNVGNVALGTGIGGAVGGPIGALFGTATGAIFSAITGIFGKKNDEDKNEYKAYEAMADYYEKLNEMGKSGYEQEYNQLLKEREDTMTQLNDEMSKKKSDDEAIEQYKEKVAELDDQIRYYAEDLAKELWDIDIQGWADQFADALTSAWENGTSAAVAYGDTVQDILQSIGKKMLQESIIEPMFANLEKTLFGEDGTGGLFDFNDPEKSQAKVVDYLAKYFGDGGEGQKTITAANEFWDGIEQVLNQYGLSAKETGSSTLSSGIQGMSEETADLLAGYVNALRQDVSVMRIQQAEFIGQYWQEYLGMITSANSSLVNIEQNVAAMARVQAEMSETLGNLYSKINRVTQGTEKFYMK